LWGAAVFCRRGWPYALCLGPAVYVTCLHTVFVSSIRYRHPAMLALIVLAAGVTVAKIPWGRRSGQRRSPHTADDATD
jgi:hypothetical protein